MFLGLRTAIYHVADLDAAKAWYARLLSAQPYFDQPFYVGFNVGGFELGLVPAPEAKLVREAAGVAYWGVAKIEPAFDQAAGLGAVAVEDVTDVGEGIKVASLRDPFGNIIGLIENPHFKNS